MIASLSTLPSCAQAKGWLHQGFPPLGLVYMIGTDLSAAAPGLPTALSLSVSTWSERACSSCCRRAVSGWLWPYSPSKM